MGVGQSLEALHASGCCIYYADCYKNESVCEDTCPLPHLHTQIAQFAFGVRAMVQYWPCFFLPSVVGQSVSLQTDKALLKVQCTPAFALSSETLDEMLNFSLRLCCT